jgi:hypothetical protein
VFAFEHLNSNTHCHGVIRLNGADPNKFNETFYDDRNVFLKKLIKSATIYVQDRSGMPAIKYMTKDQYFANGDDTITFLSEYHKK